MDALLICAMKRILTMSSLQNGYESYHYYCHYHRLGAAHHRRHLQQVQMIIRRPLLRLRDLFFVWRLEQSLYILHVVLLIGSVVKFIVAE